MKVYKLSKSEAALNAMIAIMDKQLEKCRPFVFPSGLVRIEPIDQFDLFCYFLKTEKGSIIQEVLNQ